MVKGLSVVLLVAVLMAAVPAVAAAHHVAVECYNDDCSRYKVVECLNSDCSTYRTYDRYAGDRYCYEYNCGGRYGYPPGHGHGYWHRHVETHAYWHWHEEDEGPTPLGAALLGLAFGLILGAPVAP